VNSKAKRRDQVIAIDLGARTTKAVHLQRRGEKISLVNYVLIDAPSPDQSLSVELLGNHIKDTAKALGTTRNRQISLAIGVNDSLFRHVELPMMPVADMRQNAQIQFKEYLQQDLPDYVFDCCYILQRKPEIKANDPSRKEAPKVGPQKQKVAWGEPSGKSSKNSRTPSNSQGCYQIRSSRPLSAR